MGPDDTLSPSESTDSDEIANMDGDEVVDPPDAWHGDYGADGEESLDRKLAAEQPEQPQRAAEDRDQHDDRDEGDDSFFTVVR